MKRGHLTKRIASAMNVRGVTNAREKQLSEHILERDILTERKLDEIIVREMIFHNKDSRRKEMLVWEIAQE